MNCIVGFVSSSGMTKNDKAITVKIYNDEMKIDDDSGIDPEYL